MWKPATTLAWMLIVSACDGVQRDPGFDARLHVDGQSLIRDIQL